MPEKWLEGMWLEGIPIQAGWRIAILRLIFRRRWYVQIGPEMYVLRTPVDDSGYDPRGPFQESKP